MITIMSFGKSKRTIGRPNQALSEDDGHRLRTIPPDLQHSGRTLALPGEIERWSMPSLREKVVKIGAKVVTHARYKVFQMAEVAVPRDLFRRILEVIDELRPRQWARC